MPEDNHVNLKNAGRPGDDTYQKVIAGISEDRVCPFCPEHLLKYHKNPIVKEGERWLVTTNMYPYKNTKFHFLLIHKNHVTNTVNMPTESFLELQDHINWILKEYKISGGSLLMRCGNTEMTGATVTHIHAHFIVADFDNKDREPVMVRVG